MAAGKEGGDGGIKWRRGGGVAGREVREKKGGK